MLSGRPAPAPIRAQPVEVEGFGTVHLAIDAGQYQEPNFKPSLVRFWMVLGREP
jgi:hypothetical protein